MVPRLMGQKHPPQVQAQRVQEINVVRRRPRQGLTARKAKCRSPRSQRRGVLCGNVNGLACSACGGEADTADVCCAG